MQLKIVDVVDDQFVIITPDTDSVSSSNKQNSFRNGLLKGTRLFGDKGYNTTVTFPK